MDNNDKFLFNDKTIYIYYAFDHCDKRSDDNSRVLDKFMDNNGVCEKYICFVGIVQGIFTVS